MNSTALRAEELKGNGSSLVPHGTEQRRIGTENTGMIFKNGEHENFYYGMLKHMRFQDCYHRALVYVLGISGDTRRNFKRIYDVESGCVRTECLQEGWLTSGSGRIIRMAFNLYCNGTPSVYDYEDNEEYAGKATDVHKGVVYIRLSNGVNAVAYSCYDYRTPGKKDDVSFAVTRLDEERSVAVGIITRIVRRNL